MCDCENCKGGTTVDSVAVRLAEIERASRRNLVVPRNVFWLILALRQKMAECESLKAELKEVEK